MNLEGCLRVFLSFVSLFCCSSSADIGETGLIHDNYLAPSGQCTVPIAQRLGQREDLGQRAGKAKCLVSGVVARRVICEGNTCYYRVTGCL